MQDTVLKRNTYIYILFLLLAGVGHMLELIRIPFIGAVFAVIDMTIYAGLIIYWIQSVRQRLLPSHTRRYMIAAAFLMLSLLILRSLRYHIFEIGIVLRYLWYLYYVPLIIAPALFAASCYAMTKKRRARLADERLLLILALIIALGVLTNDLHHFAFVPDPDLIGTFVGDSGSYTYGFLFYITYGWIVLTVILGVLFLLKLTGKPEGKVNAPLFVMITWVILICLHNLCVRYIYPYPPYQFIEICIFCMIGIFEACIRSRLMPYNSDYPVFFENMKIPAVVTDTELSTVYRTAVPLELTKEAMKSSVGHEVWLDKDTLLTGKNIRAGFAFWTQDESTLHRLNGELADANRILADENEVLEREREQRAEQAMVRERNALYQKAAEAVYPAQKKISKLLSEADPDAADFPAQIAKILLLSAYVKRKYNFVMMGAESGTVTAGELAAAIKETTHYLGYCKVEVTVETVMEADISCDKVMKIYDCLELIIEAVYGKAKEMWIRLSENDLIILADCPAVSFGDAPLPVEITSMDTETRFTVRTGGAA